MTPFLERVELLTRFGIPEEELLGDVTAVVEGDVVHCDPYHVSQLALEGISNVDLREPHRVVCECVLSRHSFWAGANPGDLVARTLSQLDVPVDLSDPVEVWRQLESSRELLRELFAAQALRSGSWPAPAAALLMRLCNERLNPLQASLRSEGSRTVLLERLGLAGGRDMVGLVSSHYLEDLMVVGAPEELLVVAAAAHAVALGEGVTVSHLPSGLAEQLDEALPSLLTGQRPCPDASRGLWEVFGTLWADAGRTRETVTATLDAALAIALP